MAGCIVLVDDHPLLALGLREQLERTGAAVEILDPVVGPEALISAVADRAPACAVVDLGLPFPGGGAALIGPLARRSVRTVVLTGETERGRWIEASQAGAEVIVSKAEALDEIVDVIVRVAAAEPVRPHQRAELAAEHRVTERDRRRSREPFVDLSPREQEVLAGLMGGYGPSDLAARDFVSVETVRTQVKSVLRKLRVGSQLEAVALAHRSGWGPGSSAS
jgi:DNA-binding NarL/FixJ family response regulator